MMNFYLILNLIILISSINANNSIAKVQNNNKNNNIIEKEIVSNDYFGSVGRLQEELFVFRHQLISFASLCDSKPDFNALIDINDYKWNVSNNTRIVFMVKYHSCLYLVDSTKVSSNVRAASQRLEKLYPDLRIAILTMSKIDLI